jgi:hypothetical protein
VCSGMSRVHSPAASVSARVIGMIDDALESKGAASDCASGGSTSTVSVGLFGFRCNTIRLGLETDHHIHLLVRDYNLPLREK